MQSNMALTSTALNRNFIKQNIIELVDTQKRVPKKLLENFISSFVHPEKLLAQKCPLTDFLHAYCQLAINRFIEIYRKSNQFYFMKFGNYCQFVGTTQFIQEILIFYFLSISFAISKKKKTLGKDSHTLLISMRMLVSFTTFNPMGMVKGFFFNMLKKYLLMTQFFVIFLKANGPMEKL